MLETVQQKQSVCLRRKKQDIFWDICLHIMRRTKRRSQIAVQKEARRQGAAGKLMQALEHHCEEHKMEKLLLDVRRVMRRRAASIRKTDLRIRGGWHSTGFYVNPSEDAVLMSRQPGADV